MQTWGVDLGSGLMALGRCLSSHWPSEDNEAASAGRQMDDGSIGLRSGVGRHHCETIFLFLSAPDWAKKETQCHSFLTTIHNLCIGRDVFTRKSCWGSIFKAYFVSNTQTHQLTGFHLNKRVHMHTNLLFIVGFMEFSDYSSSHVNSIIRYPLFQKGRLFDYEKD